MWLKWENRCGGIGRAEHRLSAVTKKATREKWPWWWFKLRVVSFHGMLVAAMAAAVVVI